MIKEFPNKMWKRRAVDYLITKIDLDGTTARKPGSWRPKSVQTTQNVEIVSELICSQEDTPHSHLSPREIAQQTGISFMLNIACKLISTILCDWHCLVVCQHNSWAYFIFRQHRKRTILFLQRSVETRSRCCRQYMHCFVGNLFRCKSAKNYKIRLRFYKAILI